MDVYLYVEIQPQQVGIMYLTGDEKVSVFGSKTHWEDVKWRVISMVAFPLSCLLRICRTLPPPELFRYVVIRAELTRNSSPLGQPNRIHVGRMARNDIPNVNVLITNLLQLANIGGHHFLMTYRLIGEKHYRIFSQGLNV